MIQDRHRPIARRFAADGVPSVRVDARQRESIRRFLRECAGKLVELRCVVCGAGDFAPVAEKDRYGIPLATGVCGACGHLQAYRYYTPDVIERFYRDHYRDVYGETSPADAFARHRARGRESFAYVRDALPARGRVLEIGCGTGGALSPYRDAGFDVTGVDMDRDFLDYGKTQGLRLIEASFDDFETDERFDLVILSHVLEHFSDPYEKLVRVRHLLAPGGMLFVEVPSIHRVAAGDADMMRAFQNAHVSYFTEASFARLAARAGFALVRANDLILALMRPCSPHETAPGSATETHAALAQMERRYRSAGLLRRVKRRLRGWRNRLRSAR